MYPGPHFYMIVLNGASVISDPIDAKFWLLYSIVPELSNAINPVS